MHPLQISLYTTHKVLLDALIHFVLIKKLPAWKPSSPWQTFFSNIWLFVFCGLLELAGGHREEQVIPEVPGLLDEAVRGHEQHADGRGNVGLAVEGDACVCERKRERGRGREGVSVGCGCEVCKDKEEKKPPKDKTQMHADITV